MLLQHVIDRVRFHSLEPLLERQFCVRVVVVGVLLLVLLHYHVRNLAH